MCLYCQRVKPIRTDLPELTVFAILRRAGGNYERAFLAQPRDHSACIQLEQFFEAMQIHYPEIWVGIQAVKGRNKIRRLRGLEELNY